MNNDIFIIIDNSGSMNEIAKPLLTRNLLRGINQLSIVEPDLYAHIRFHFFLWGNNVNEMTLTESGDIPIPTPNGLANLEVLEQFTNEQLTKENSVAILLLSDGAFERPAMKKFCNFSGKTSGCIIHSLSLGADANEYNLKMIATNNEVFCSEDIFAAISSLIRYHAIPITLPSSLSRSMFQTQKILEEV